jgi:hypothetical protein
MHYSSAILAEQQMIYRSLVSFFGCKTKCLFIQGFNGIEYRQGPEVQQGEKEGHLHYILEAV